MRISRCLWTLAAAALLAAFGACGQPQQGEESSEALPEQSEQLQPVDPETDPGDLNLTNTEPEAELVWTCPMHPDVRGVEGGDCPICGMDLVQKPMSEVAGAPSAEGEPLGEPIKIGAVFAVTGPAAWLGEPEANTVEMVVEQINDAGGVKGRPVEILMRDTQGDSERCVNAVRELIREDVVAIIGPSRSGTSMAVAQICEDEEVPLVSCAALAAIVEPEPGQVRKWVFKTPQRDDHVVQRIFEDMQAKGMSKVALITGTTGFGSGGRESLQAAAPDHGIEIVADETYGPGDTDMTVQLTKIKQAEPDAVVNWSIVPAQSIMMKNMQDLGLEAQLYQSHGFGNYSYLAAAGDAAEGVLFPAGRALVVEDLPEDHPQKAVLTKLKNDYEARYDEPLSTFAGHAWDALMLVVEACRNVDEINRSSIRDAIEGTQGFVGTGGVYNFTPEDHTGLDKFSLEMVTVRDGEFAVAPK